MIPCEERVNLHDLRDINAGLGCHTSFMKLGVVAESSPWPRLARLYDDDEFLLLGALVLLE